MRRLSVLPLSALAALCVAAQTARADDPPADEQTPPAAEAPTAPPPSPEPAAPPSPSPSAADSTAIPVLKPAASAEDEAEKKEDKFPLHGSASLSNSWGNGWLAHPETFQQQPSWSTSLGLNARASLPKLDYLPKMGLSTGVSFSMANWLPAYSNGGVYERIVRVSDINVGLSMGELYKEEFTKISIGLSLNGRIPISLTSRQAGLITSLGGSVPFSWTSDEVSWGQIGVNFAPSVRFPIFGAVSSSVPGVSDVTTGGNTANPLANPNAFPVAYCRSNEVQANGDCVLRGRQTLASVNNNLGVSWSLGDHSVSASLGISVGFLRGLSNHPELSSEFASGQNYNDASTNGNISYSYKLPIETDVSINAGVGSGQSLQDNQGNFRFPFWDFYYPANNSSAAFVDVSVGI